MDIICLQCKKSFSLMPYRAKQQRFCSKACWYAWHRGKNNNQTNRITVTCDHCGEQFEKTPRKVGQVNYCSPKCARAEHGNKIVGEKHPNWKGGALNGRGPRWDKIRLQIIARQNHCCADCGMTEAEHKTRFGRSFSVHHRSPYRLDQNNHPDNLIALCPACHGIEEAATRRKLSPEDWIKIRKNTAESQARGLDLHKFGYVYDLCPQCDQPKAKKAALCRKCRDKVNAQTRKPHFTCPICGGPKTTAVAKMCWGCRTARK